MYDPISVETALVSSGGDLLIQLSDGNVINAGRRSPNSLYDEDIATMEGGQEEAYNQNDATGFIALNGLRLKQFARVNDK